MAFTLLPPIPASETHHGCLNCGHTEMVCPLDAYVAAGFGSASITKGDETIFSEDPNSEEDPPRLQKFEDIAKLDPDHDWRFTLYLPLREADYQRQGDGRWVLVRSGPGFA